jgi:serine/threonine protein kinase
MPRESEPVSNVIPIRGRRRPGKLEAGELFVGRYRLLERLGRGGMGEVWTAFDEKVHRVVALKLLHPKLLVEPGARARFDRESLAMAELEHERVVRLYDWGTEPQPFIVMKRIVGTTLRALLREQHRIPWIYVVCFALQIAEGLSAMHRSHLWHRDIKPENLMVDEEGYVTILDLGIACDANCGRGGATDRLGTRGYLPPETILGLPADHRRDLYALGVVLHELLTGRQPFSDVEEASDTEVQAAHVHDAPDPIRARVRDCPEALEALVLRLLEKDPDRRYQGAREVVAAIGDVLRQHGSLPPGDDATLLVLRMLGRRKLNKLAEDAEAQAEQERGAEPPTGSEDTAPIAPGFVAPSPASPSSRPAAVEPAVIAPLAPHHVPRGPRVCGAYPAAVVPEGIAPVSTVELPRAAVPPAREPFPLAKPRARRAVGAKEVYVVWLIGVMALAVLVAVVTAWALGVK